MSIWDNTLLLISAQKTHCTPVWALEKCKGNPRAMSSAHLLGKCEAVWSCWEFAVCDLVFFLFPFTSCRAVLCRWLIILMRKELIIQILILFSLTHSYINVYMIFHLKKTIQMTNFLSFFQINRFHAEKQMKQEEQRKKDMERLVELRREIEEQVQKDKER